MSNCSICGKDICTEHTYLITKLGSHTPVGELCLDCFNERFKLKKEDWEKIHRLKDDDGCPKEHWLFGGEE